MRLDTIFRKILALGLAAVLFLNTPGLRAVPIDAASARSPWVSWASEAPATLEAQSARVQNALDRTLYSRVPGAGPRPGTAEVRRLIDGQVRIRRGLEAFCREALWHSLPGEGFHLLLPVLTSYFQSLAGLTYLRFLVEDPDFEYEEWVRSTAVSVRFSAIRDVRFLRQWTALKSTLEDQMVFTGTVDSRESPARLVFALKSELSQNFAESAFATGGDARALIDTAQFVAANVYTENLAQITLYRGLDVAQMPAIPERLLERFPTLRHKQGQLRDQWNVVRDEKWKLDVVAHLPRILGELTRREWTLKQVLARQHTEPWRSPAAGETAGQAPSQKDEELLDALALALEFLPMWSFEASPLPALAALLAEVQLRALSLPTSFSEPHSPLRSWNDADVASRGYARWLTNRLPEILRAVGATQIFSESAIRLSLADQYRRRLYEVSRDLQEGEPAALRQMIPALVFTALGRQRDEKIYATEAWRYAARFGLSPDYPTARRRFWIAFAEAAESLTAPPKEAHPMPTPSSETSAEDLRQWIFRLRPPEAARARITRSALGTQATDSALSEHIRFLLQIVDIADHMGLFSPDPRTQGFRDVAVRQEYVKTWNEWLLNRHPVLALDERGRFLSPQPSAEFQAILGRSTWSVLATESDAGDRARWIDDRLATQVEHLTQSFSELSELTGESPARRWLEDLGALAPSHAINHFKRVIRDSPTLSARLRHHPRIRARFYDFERREPNPVLRRLWMDVYGALVGGGLTFLLYYRLITWSLSLRLPIAGLGGFKSTSGYLRSLENQALGAYMGWYMPMAHTLMWFHFLAERPASVFYFEPLQIEFAERVHLSGIDGRVLLERRHIEELQKEYQASRIEYFSSFAHMLGMMAVLHMLRVPPIQAATLGASGQAAQVAEAVRREEARADHEAQERERWRHLAELSMWAFATLGLTEPTWDAQELQGAWRRRQSKVGSSSLERELLDRALAHLLEVMEPAREWSDGRDDRQTLLAAIWNRDPADSLMDHFTARSRLRPVAAETEFGRQMAEALHRALHRVADRAPLLQDVQARLRRLLTHVLASTEWSARLRHRLHSSEEAP